MFKKLNTSTLLIIFTVLVAIVLFNKFYKNKKEESTFRAEFIRIDTSDVSSILIYPQAEKGKEIKITKNGQRWELQNDKIKSFADSNAVRALLSTFAELKSLSLAGTDKSSWGDLQVTDSAGTRLKITAGGKTHDMVIGKFSYDQATGGGSSYIRMKDEEEVYSIPGYLSFSINQPFNSWRNKTLVNGNPANWNSITFSYPADSSFMLTKANNEWIINGERTDSSKAVQFMNQLSHLQATGFVDGYTPASTPVFTVSINGNNQSNPITIQAYLADSTMKFVYHSSLNPEAYFSEAESHLKDRLFVSRAYFAATK